MNGATSTVESRTRTSAALRLKLALARGPSSQRFWTRPDLREIFPEYLFLVHCIIRASVPLMEAAVAAAQSKGAGDAVASQLADYFSHHITEETDHDEWLLDDMEVLGFRREEILNRVPPPEVAELVGAQYYWLYHAHPVALLGYVAVLEGDPPLEQELESAALRTPKPSPYPSCCTGQLPQLI